MKLAIALFIITYVLLLIFQNIRHYIALGSALLFVILGILPVSKIFEAIDFNVLLMIAGTMGLISLFIESKMPNLLADILVSKVPNVKWAVVSLALFAGFISAFVDNVATVLMVVPVALSISKRFEINPVPMVIAIALSSNLQGAATLVGDTTSILLGGYANLDFLDFFVLQGKPGMFFIVEFGAFLTIFVLLYLFRKLKQPIEPTERTKVTNYVPSILLLIMLALLIGVSFIPNKPSITNGLICTGLFIVGLIIEAIKKKDLSVFKLHLKEIDYQTLGLLTGIFIVIGGITEAGVIDAIAKFFANIGGNNLFLIYTIITFFSVILSAFIDNIPYVATMLPVVQGVATTMGVDPLILYFGLLSGATLGGNITPIGASANITAIGILKKEGHSVKTSEFMKIGIPFTLTAVLSAYVVIWLIWS
ncbi:MAG: TRAP transporter large permease subunit [Ruminococcaceae bacterium]|nr:TRAP transporter large permease subunit [Oscillospiraceae bacterium]